MTPPMDRVEVWAPGCIGNIGPGLDILGLAVSGEGDSVVAELAAGGLRITSSGHPDLPTDPGRHTAGISAREVLARAGHT
jgi:homoserine kinase